VIEFEGKVYHLVPADMTKHACYGCAFNEWANCGAIKGATRCVDALDRVWEEVKEDE
jgi:hypothetical protein